jgi:hypothetical protein
LSSNPYLSGMGYKSEKGDKPQLTAKERLEQLKNKRKDGKGKERSKDGKHITTRLNPELQKEIELRMQKKQNEVFSRSLTQTGKEAEISASSDDLSDDSNIANKGDLIIVPLNLGKLGFRQLHAYTEEDPELTAGLFCKINKLGPKTRIQIVDLINKRKAKFTEFSFD